MTRIATDPAALIRTDSRNAAASIPRLAARDFLLEGLLSAALRQEIADLFEQHLLARRRGGRLFLLLHHLAAQHVNGADEQKQDEGDDDEVDGDRQEIPPGEDGALPACLGQRIRRDRLA